MKYDYQVLSSGHVLAESPGWSRFEYQYHWVDIETSELFLYRGEERRSLHFPAGTTSVHSLGANDYLVTGRNSLFRVQNGTADTLWDDREAAPSWRFNDSYHLGGGRLIVGTKSTTDNHFGQKLGMWDGRDFFWLFEGMTLANGMAMDSASKVFYAADSIAGQILRWPVGPGGLPDFGSEPDVFLSGLNGEPDGLALDNNGGLWVALWGAGEVLCFDSKGRKIGGLSLGAQYVSSIEWVGMKQKDLLITTAAGGNAIHTNPHANCIGGDVVLIASVRE